MYGFARLLVIIITMVVSDNSPSPFSFDVIVIFLIASLLSLRQTSGCFSSLSGSRCKCRYKGFQERILVTNELSKL